MNRRHHTTDWILRDNVLHDYYGRVMLYADHGTVRGNRVQGSYYHLGNSVAYFEHAGACRNVVTHGNYFVDTHADSSKWGGSATTIAFHEIVYSANSFDGRGLSLNQAADALVLRNLFEGADAGLDVNRSQDVRISRNLHRETPDREFVVHGSGNVGISMNDNLQLP